MFRARESHSSIDIWPRTSDSLAFRWLLAIAVTAGATAPVVVVVVVASVQTLQSESMTAENRQSCVHVSVMIQLSKDEFLSCCSYNTDLPLYRYDSIQ